jgi:dTDP-4-amino-4,6-dideoxygalactose transaminase
MKSSAVGQGPQIPLFDLRVTEDDLREVAAVLRSGALGPGPRVAELEAALASRLGAAHAVAVCSGTAALHLSYRACGVGPGDEVVVPAITFVATASTVVHCGGTPVFADIRGRHDWGIDPADVAACLSPRTKAVCAVHYGGYPAAVDELAALCADRGIALVEDTAHAPGATLKGRSLGTWGAAGAFSFFSNKVLSAGEGGLVVVPDAARAELVRRWAASDPLDGQPEGGGERLNYSLDEPRAALLLSRLRRMDAEIARRRQLTLAYRAKLAHLAEVEIPFSEDQLAESACYVMPIALSDATRRDAIRTRMRETYGVQTSVLYPALHELAAYRARHGRGSLPHAERVAASEVTLPLYPHMTDDEQDLVVTALEDSLRA